ncbi:MAG: FtsX-like permease family protein [Defluviitaleaceae bacterium]|nr:FtsX-like permease family protein [Defluviitaleaceae bacterium]
MIIFLLRKMWRNKWMVLSLLLGNILLIGIVSATPLYTTATMQRILQQEIRNYQREHDRIPTVLELDYLFNVVAPTLRMDTYQNTRDIYWRETVDAFGVTQTAEIKLYSLNNWQFIPYIAREERPHIRRLEFITPEDLHLHVTLLQGRFPADEIQGENIIEAIITPAASSRHNILMGELLEILNVDDPEGTLFVQIVGFYEPAEGSEIFWATVPFTPINGLIGSAALVRDALFPRYIVDYNIRAHWISVLDARGIRALNAEHYIRTAAYFIERFNSSSWVWRFNENFTKIIESYISDVDNLPVLLWMLQIPVYVLLAFFIFMVSRQIILSERGDIAILKSRGASRGQVVVMYVLQGIIIGAVSLTPGLTLGWGMCRVLGASGGFLQWVQREALQIEITREAIIYAATAVVISFITMLAPVISFTRTDIIGYKRRHSGKQKNVFWQRYFLDILCLGLAVYGIYIFRTSEITVGDPLLFAGSSLFIIGFGLVCLRFYPWIIKSVYFIGRRLWPPSVYASFIRMIRSRCEEQFIMIFLVFTLAAGVFGAQAARTINLNNERHIHYLGGADLVFREHWRYTALLEPGGPGGGNVLNIRYIEPDFDRFTQFDEVEAVTQVKRSEITIRARNSVVSHVQLMAVDTYGFGHVAWFRDDLLPAHMNHFLNVLAARPNGVLLSDNFRTRLGYRLRDEITLLSHNGADMRAVVLGFVDYWPGFAPTQRVLSPAGEWLMEEQYLAVANIGRVQQAWGIMPYQIWMRTQSESNRFFYEYLNRENVRLDEFNDVKGLLVQSRSNPVLQGINGILTVGFLVILLVCFVGFIIYWMTSIRARTLQFGIFRAMGMRFGDIVRILVYEQIWITFAAIAIGTVVGEITAYFFVPFIQVSFAREERLIPLLVVSDFRDYAGIYIVFGLMITVCLFILGALVSRIKLDKALKLGED